MPTSTRNILANGVDTHVTQFTPENEQARGPILFLHGYGATSDHMKPVAERISRQTRRKTYLLDLPGMGQSGHPPENYNVDELAKWLIQAAQTLEQEGPLDAVGFSIGARTILEGLIVEPELFKKICLISPGGIDTNDPEFQAKRIKTFKKVFGANLEKVPQHLVSLMASLFSRRLMSATELQSIRPTKTFIIFGDNDRLVSPRAFEVLIENIQNATGHQVANANHDILKSDLDEVVEEGAKFLA